MLRVDFLLHIFCWFLLLLHLLLLLMIILCVLEEVGDGETSNITCAIVFLCRIHSRLCVSPATMMTLEHRRLVLLLHILLLSKGISVIRGL
jgi:hypothetical protein